MRSSHPWLRPALAALGTLLLLAWLVARAAGTSLWALGGDAVLALRRLLGPDPVGYALATHWEAPALRPMSPSADLDLSVSTDSEDLLAFAGDLFEFAEQDRAALLDSLLEAPVALWGAGAAAFGARTLAVRLAKLRR